MLSIRAHNTPTMGLLAPDLKGQMRQGSGLRACDGPGANDLYAVANDYKEDFPHPAGGLSQPASMCQD